MKEEEAKLLLNSSEKNHEEGSTKLDMYLRAIK
jgi:hypothetical protein